MENAAETAEHAAAKVKDELKETAAKAYDEAQEAADEAAAQWGRWSDDVKSYFQEKPLMAVGLAAVAGALAGVFLVGSFSRKETTVETKVKKAVRASEEAWRHVKDGLSKTAGGVKEAMDAISGR